MEVARCRSPERNAPSFSEGDVAAANRVLSELSSLVREGL